MEFIKVLMKRYKKAPPQGQGWGLNVRFIKSVVKEQLVGCIAFNIRNLVRFINVLSDRDAIGVLYDLVRVGLHRKAFEATSVTH
tara:strand:+ start:6858 stop:7109 length:252 start_codon:yes stop_codon:yes gene_type:complete